ncbi:MAG: GNAT family N-acetyltransferase [Faecalibacterium sp.]|nr:GNAT family N-acetyltransferase [Ruminococcus sp.]MCM1392247.1 GNAT family N-acetyltransferase [Ruminococcus sp.]MCM1484950.1 GNAT family N-acetyltransferase [Faecalibacterium sp.]
MLKKAETADTNQINKFCSLYPLGTRVSCYLSAYGLDRDFFNVWYSMNESEVNAVVASFFGAVTVCANSGADFSEISDFINMYGYDSICAENDIMEKLGFTDTEDKCMFVFEKGVSYSAVKSCDDTLFKSAYALISLSIPNSFSNSRDAYLSWLSDFTFRKSRNLARMKAVCDDDRVYSCAMTAAESENAAIISGVACDSSRRGTGLGKNTVLTLANELAEEGKKVYVIALNDGAGAFYEKIGFKQCGTVSYAK